MICSRPDRGQTVSIKIYNGMILRGGGRDIRAWQALLRGARGHFQPKALSFGYNWVFTVAVGLADRLRCGLPINLPTSSDGSASTPLSIAQAPSRFFTRSVVAKLRLQTCAPLGVVRTSGSRPRFPTSNTLFSMMSLSPLHVIHLHPRGTTPPDEKRILRRVGFSAGKRRPWRQHHDLVRRVGAPERDPLPRPEEG